MPETNNQTNQTGESAHKSRPRPHYKRAAHSEPKTVVQTLVPVDQLYIGAVIGKGGATITKIKDQTKTEISLKKPDYSKGLQCHVFIISGSPQGVRKAEKWVRNTLQSTWEAEQEKEDSHTKDESTAGDE